MSWNYEYVENDDVTEIYWNGQQQTSVDGEISSFVRGYPVGDAKIAILEAIKNADESDKVEMLFDLNYGISQNE